MGCRTGFYFLTRNTLSHQQALDLMLQSLQFIIDFHDEIPGSARQECGNYREHDLEGARLAAIDLYEILSSWSPDKMNYLPSEDTKI